MFRESTPNSPPQLIVELTSNCVDNKTSLIRSKINTTILKSEQMFLIFQSVFLNTEKTLIVFEIRRQFLQAQNCLENIGYLSKL